MLFTQETFFWRLLVLYAPGKFSSLYFPLLYLSVHQWFSAFLLLPPFNSPSCSGDPSTITLFRCYLITVAVLLLWTAMYMSDMQGVWYVVLREVSIHRLRTTGLEEKLRRICYTFSKKAQGRIFFLSLRTARILSKSLFRLLHPAFPSSFNLKDVVNNLMGQALFFCTRCKSLKPESRSGPAFNEWKGHCGENKTNKTENQPKLLVSFYLLRFLLNLILYLAYLFWI